MEKYIISTGTITHAIKGRDILKKQGIKAEIERMKHGAEKYGCGYAIIVWTNNIVYAEKLMKINNVKILNINKI